MGVVRLLVQSNIIWLIQPNFQTDLVDGHLKQGDCQPTRTLVTMTRGNQRELSREKAAKRKDKQSKEGSGKDFEKRKERDSDIMREKQKKAEEKKAAEAGGGGGSSQQDSSKGKGKGK